MDQCRARALGCAPTSLPLAARTRCSQESQVLARSVKDHERRVGTKEGFSNEMGDCLAYKYYRDVSSSAPCMKVLRA